MNTKLLFRVKCLMRKLRERGKWDLVSKLAYKYGIVCIGDRFYD